MDSRRIVLALIFALLLSGGATYFFTRYRSQATAKPQTVQVVVSAKALPGGGALKADDVTLIDWPVNLQMAGTFKKVDEVVGRSLLYPVSDKEPILEHDLAAPGSGIGLTAKIPPGMRAVSVRSNEIVGVAGFLFPGSRVDVLGIFRPVGEGDPVTQTILQNVEVATAGQRDQPDPNGKPETVNVVTLFLSPEDSQKLIMASTLATTIQFVLRNGMDESKQEVKPVTLSELVTGVPAPKKPAAPVVMQARAPRRVEEKPKPPQFYTVEIINGDKRSEQKFQ